MKKSVTRTFAGRCLLAALACLAALAGCKYDDSDLWNSMKNLQARVAELEKVSESYQGDLDALRVIVEKLDDNVAITSVVETEEGYTIHFSDGQTVTVGKGESGYLPPSITVIEEDGVYYWAWKSADGTTEFILDEQGDKLPACLAAPQVRINPDTGNWEISDDAGTSWSDTGVSATGQGGGAMVEKIEAKDDSVEITLQDGTVVVVPLSKELSFAFGEEGPLYFAFGEKKRLDYTMSGAVDCTIAKPDGWKVKFADDRLEITAPAEENPYADREGTVTVVAVSPLGLSAVAKIEVLIGAAPAPEGVNLNAGGAYANCYIVSEPNTTYYFDATVMGTGIGTPGLAAPTKLNPGAVLVLWETGTESGAVVRDVTLNPGGRVSFTTTDAVNGNAVIAVTDGVPVNGDYPRGKGTVLWSWHIWAVQGVSDKPCVNHDGEQFMLMDRNLGDWEQPAGSKNTYDGLKYQWGRKDPYVGFDGSGSPIAGSIVCPEPDYVSYVGYATDTSSDEATLREAIAFPELFFSGTYETLFDWYGLGGSSDEEQLSHRNDYLWGNPGGSVPVKTIYDPCPEGYMVAPIEAFSGFTDTGETAFSASSILADGSFADGWTFTNAQSFFPAAGQLTHNSGVLRLVPGPSGREGYYWSSTAEEGNARMTDFNKSSVMFNLNKRASGCSVRCMRSE